MDTHPSITPDVSKWIDSWLAREKIQKPFHLETLAGDGSTRSFFRLVTPTRSFVLLVDPGWMFTKDYAVHQAYLKSKKLPVPDFYSSDSKIGVMLMQDLGDELLQSRFLSRSGERLEWLLRTMRLLAQLHGSTFPVPVELPVASRRFDSKKYLEELEFTWEHLVSGYLKFPSRTHSQSSALQEFTAELSQIGPDVFCHRDFHSRNLIVHENKLYTIDFQDARLGCPHYDLASFIFDAYVPLTSEMRNQAIEEYRVHSQKYSYSKHVDWKQFQTHMHLIALQRLMKAAGSFASFQTRFNKPNHLRYIIPALELASEVGQSTSLTKKILETFDVNGLKKAMGEKKL